MASYHPARSGRKTGQKLRALAFASTALAAALGLAACNDSDDDGDVPIVSVPAPTPTPTATPTPAAVALRCDDTMKTNFKPDANTTVLVVKSFARGDALTLGTAAANTPRAAADLCFVKLQVGPGNPGPAGAPSTSAGIGIEVWLPAASAWNKRYHALGGGGWAGGNHLSTTAIADANSAPSIAAAELSVTSTTDTGHSVGNGSFAMLPDGSINTTLWRDFSERGIHEMAVKTKALISAYYLAPANKSYWDGFSTGGRQGSKLAQVHPTDFDGILAGAPVVNWTRFITAELYPQIVYQRDLGGVPISTAQATLVGNAAINACDLVDGQHLGYIADPTACRYDPTTDASVICTANGGSSSAPGCVTPQQALAINKIWYGQTDDGSVPSPLVDNGLARVPAGRQRWYGLGRGTAFFGLAGPGEFPVASDQVALELQYSAIAGPGFINATGNGRSLWRNLSYADLSRAFDLGINLQPEFANINTDNPDLSAFSGRGGKLLYYHGTADILVPYPGTVNYYERVAAQMGGLPAIQSFSRLYLIPGMSHGFSNGTTNAAAVVPLPTRDQLFQALVAWVENGTAPGRVEATAAATANAPARSRPLCPYPQRVTFVSGDPYTTASYQCR